MSSTRTRLCHALHREPCRLGQSSVCPWHSLKASSPRHTHAASWRALSASESAAAWLRSRQRHRRGSRPLMRFAATKWRIKLVREPGPVSSSASSLGRRSRRAFRISHRANSSLSGAPVKRESHHVRYVRRSERCRSFRPTPRRHIRRSAANLPVRFGPGWRPA